MELLIAISLGAFTFTVMIALYSFSQKSAQSASRRNRALTSFSRVADTIKKKTASASYVYSPNQDTVKTTIAAGYINASYIPAPVPDFLPIDDSKDPEFFYICVSDPGKDGYGIYLYSGQLTEAHLTPIILPCGTDVEYATKTTLLSSVETGDFDLEFSRPVTPANMLTISLVSTNPAISGWLMNWDFTALTQQPATITYPDFNP